MKKISLLAASVALALVGCGGSDGDSSTSTPSAGGIVITGFDGYFKNAVVFNDVNNNGVLDVNVDTVFGLTDKLGQIELPKDTVIQGSIALQTLRPGDVKKELAIKLAALSPAADTFSDFMNTYTTDMDHEGQPMANAVVFRAPVSSEAKTAVISPLTDLVAIEMKNKNIDEKAAIAAVTAALGGTTEQPIDLFSDFVKDSKTNLASAKLHKTAQILTESKAKNPAAYETNSVKIAEIAQEESEKIVTDKTMGTNDLLNQKPVINPSSPTDTVVSNYKLLVNEAAKAEIAKEISTLDITEGESLNATITIPANLFQDKYDNTQTNVQAVVKINGKGEIKANLVGETLTLSAVNLQPTSDTYTITLTAEDKATADSEVLNTLSTTFSFKVKLSNTAPVVDETVQVLIQKDISTDWKLKQGVIFSESILVDGLFDDREGDKLTYTTDIETVIPGLKSSYDPSTGMITISGKPQKTEAAKKQFTIIANDGHAAIRILSKPATFELPTVDKGEITVVDSVTSEIQENISKQWSLKVSKPFKETLDISGLFSDDISGDIEYYANYASHDHTAPTNPISGVKVSVDKSGLVTLSGTPTKETTGVILYVAKGINFSGGEDNDIESEMVLLKLPNVKPAEEVIPPTDTKLEDITWYVAEYGTVDGFDTDTGHDQIWCESIKFNNGKVFTNTRSATNLKSCSEANVEWDGATYTVSNAGKTIDVSLQTEKNGEEQIETMRYALTQTEDNISNGSATVYTQEINASDKITYSERYTFFSKKTDLEARLNIQSNSGWEGRVFPMYLPSASGQKLGTVTLSLEENTNSNDTGYFDADVTFDLPGESITCEMLRGVFHSFTFSNGSDITSTSNDYQTSSFECYNGQDNDSEIQHATVDFDLPNLTVNDVYSILGKTTESGRSQVELIKFNIEWAGVGSNE